VLVNVSLRLDIEEDADHHELACAIAFFGQIKNVGDDQVESFVTMVLEPLLKAFPHVDVYFHSYHMTTMDNPRNLERNVSIDVGGSTTLLLTRLRQVPRVSLRGLMFSEPEDADNSFWSLDYYLEKGDPWGNKGLSMRNLLRQFYSLDQVSKLWWPRRKEYQAVVFTRPDLFFKSSLQFPMPFPKNTLFSPSFDRWKGLNDRFAMGSPEVMMLYGQRMRWIEPYFRQHKAELHAESYLMALMQMNKIELQFLDGLTFTRVRANGRMGASRARLR